jgi:hypothetical protein
MFRCKSSQVEEINMAYREIEVIISLSGTKENDQIKFENKVVTFRRIIQVDINLSTDDVASFISKGLTKTEEQLRITEEELNVAFGDG